MLSPMSEEDRTRAALDDFDAAFATRDPDAIVAAMTDDCRFESTSPPDGVVYEGRTAVRGAWADLFAAAPDATFETEDRLVAGDRAVVRWTYRWGGGDGPDGGHVRGVDLYVVRDGKVAEKRSYVKG